MMEYIRSAGALFWLFPILWAALFLWARFLAYPLALKRRIRMGKTWCYVPEWWSKKPLVRFGVILFLTILAVFSAFMTAASLFLLLPPTACWFVFLFLAFLIVAKPLTNFAMNGVYRLQVNAMKKAESENRLLKYLREMSKLEIAAEKEESNHEHA